MALRWLLLRRGGRNPRRVSATSRLAEAWGGVWPGAPILTPWARARVRVRRSASGRARVFMEINIGNCGGLWRRGGGGRRRDSTCADSTYAICGRFFLHLRLS